MQLLGTKVCKKHDLGVHNNLFGGTMLSWIDESAVAFVNEVCHCPTMVTLKMEEVLFKSPVKENNLIKIYGQIDRIGGKSITISVEARKFNVYSQEEDVVCSTSLVFVRLDDDGKSITLIDRPYARTEVGTDGTARRTRREPLGRGPSGRTTRNAHEKTNQPSIVASNDEFVSANG